MLRRCRWTYRFPACANWWSGWRSVEQLGQPNLDRRGPAGRCVAAYLAEVFLTWDAGRLSDDTTRLGGGFYGPAWGGGFGWTAGSWGGRCRSWCRRPPDVATGGGFWMSRCPVLLSLQRVRLRSRWCCQRAAAVCSCAAPVGRRSLGWMALAVRHTAISPMMARLGRLPGGAHTGCVLLCAA